MPTNPSMPAMVMASPEDYLRAAVSFRKQRKLATTRGSSTSNQPPASKTSKGANQEAVVADSETECEAMLTVSGSTSGDHAAKSQSSNNRTKREKSHQLSPVKEDMQGVSTLSASSTAASVTSPEITLPPQPAQISESLATPTSAQQDPGPQNNPGAVMVLMSNTQATVLVVTALLMAALLGALALWLTLAFDPYSLLVKLVYSIPNVKQHIVLRYSRTRTGIYHSLQGRLEAMIARLERFKDILVIAQRTGNEM